MTLRTYESMRINKLLRSLYTYPKSSCWFTYNACNTGADLICTIIEEV